jgi:hypothetical protein
MRNVVQRMPDRRHGLRCEEAAGEPGVPRDGDRYSDQSERPNTSGTSTADLPSVKFTQALVGGTQSGLDRVILGAVLEPGVECGQASLAPLLQSVGFDRNLTRDGLDRFTQQQSQDDISLRAALHRWIGLRTAVSVTKLGMENELLREKIARLVIPATSDRANPMSVLDFFHTEACVS